MRDVGEPLDLHAPRNVDGAGAADARQVVAAEVDEHHVLRTVLFGGEEPLDVSLGRLGGACDRAEARAPVLAGDEPLGRGPDERQAVELQQEQVRRRVHPAEGAVDLERRRRGRTLGPLGRDALEHIARDDVALDLPHHLLVALAARGSP